MKISRFTMNPFGMNCYILWSGPGGQCIVIDPGMMLDSEKEMITSFTNPNHDGGVYAKAFDIDMPGGKQLRVISLHLRSIGMDRDDWNKLPSGIYDFEVWTATDTQAVGT